MPDTNWPDDPSDWIEPNGGCVVCGIHFSYHKIPCGFVDIGILIEKGMEVCPR